LGAGDGLAAAFREVRENPLPPALLINLVFLGVFLGFAVKVPLVPFHTWLPGAYTAAPTGVAMVLTGVMSKMGVYGFLRILLPMFPSRCARCTPALAGDCDRPVRGGHDLPTRSQADARLLLDQHRAMRWRCLRRPASTRGRGPGSGAERGVLQMFNHGLTAAVHFVSSAGSAAARPSQPGRLRWLARGTGALRLDGDCAVLLLNLPGRRVRASS
jgi:NADH-quinone oxidoreductase subunit M